MRGQKTASPASTPGIIGGRLQISTEAHTFEVT